MCRKYHFVDAFWCFVCAMKNEPKKDTYVTMNGRPNEWDGLVHSGLELWFREKKSSWHMTFTQS